MLLYKLHKHSPVANGTTHYGFRILLIVYIANRKWMTLLGNLTQTDRQRLLRVVLDKTTSFMYCHKVTCDDISAGDDGFYFQWHFLDKPRHELLINTCEQFFMFWLFRKTLQYMYAINFILQYIRERLLSHRVCVQVGRECPPRSRLNVVVESFVICSFINIQSVTNSYLTRSLSSTFFSFMHSNCTVLMNTIRIPL